MERAELRNCPCGSTISLLLPMRVLVVYAIEAIDAGWIVWRSTAAGELALGSGQRAQVFHTRRSAEDAVTVQRRSDAAAASRLGVELVTEDKSDAHPLTSV